jgi:hypothetical protein
MIDDQLDVVEDNGVKYNRKYFEFIKAFALIGKDSRIFPKKCRTCGREYFSFPEYIHRTNPRAHCLEQYSVPLDANQTLQYRNCACGTTLVIMFTKETLPVLDGFWETLGKESKRRNKPLREVVLEFREQCNRYVVAHPEIAEP